MMMCPEKEIGAPVARRTGQLSKEAAVSRQRQMEANIIDKTTA
jgi:uncharacterized protein YbbK (DUF523 family)